MTYLLIGGLVVGIVLIMHFMGKKKNSKKKKTKPEKGVERPKGEKMPLGKINDDVKTVITGTRGIAQKTYSMEEIFKIQNLDVEYYYIKDNMRFKKRQSSMKNNDRCEIDIVYKQTGEKNGDEVWLIAESILKTHKDVEWNDIQKITGGAGNLHGDHTRIWSEIVTKFNRKAAQLRDARRMEYTS